MLYHGALSLLLLIPHTLHLSHTVHHNLLHYIEGLGSFYLLLELVHDLRLHVLRLLQPRGERDHVVDPDPRADLGAMELLGGGLHEDVFNQRALARAADAWADSSLSRACAQEIPTFLKLS